MKNLLFLLSVSILFFSCNKKTLQLPEILHSNITDVKDVSAAYIFYDVTKPDSVEFNRKNLISTTNWLVNVDKRLTLKQVIPHLKFLLDKRAKVGMHKNEKARNYFTCNDASIESLGFIDFTDVIYNNSKKTETIDNTSNEPDSIIVKFTKDFVFVNDNNVSPENLILALGNIAETPRKLVLLFDSGITFQKYINYKSILLELNPANTIIENQEFIY